jgi:exopolysaccharide biosynthesis polyprenyl glycosylphosphotransferase
MSDKTATAPSTVENFHTRDWREIYAARMAITDLLVLIWVVFGVQIAWFGFDTADVSFRGSASDLVVSYSTVSVLVIVGWLACLQIFGTRESRVLGTGPDEYKLITNASLRLFGLLAIGAFLLHIDVARGYILLAFPLGTIVLLFSRWMWRQWLCVQRLGGRFVSRVVLVGSQTSVQHLATELGRQPASGYLVVGACIQDGSGAVLSNPEIPVFRDIDELQAQMVMVSADTVIITNNSHLAPSRIRELSWSLEPGRQHLVVAPSLTDIGGPRIHTRPVSGLPLIHVETPTYGGRKHFAKRAFDILGAGTLVIILSPLLIILALVVRLTSKGPIMYRQERVGLRGKPFDMLKYRSMAVNADDQLASLLEAQGTSDTPLFKIHNDPRLTRVGGWLRKYSLDELLQLLNVLKGDMSLVGPRPQRDGEVALYDSAAHRRLLLKPGMSGLWQVSGRSSLSWEDSIRLDLYYVENWSLIGDLLILWRTAKAVVAPEGTAY